nr:hypothetical protein [Proteocatella sphenisci]
MLREIHVYSIEKNQINKKYAKMGLSGNSPLYKSDYQYNGEMLPAKLVFVRNRNNKKDCLAIISTDIMLNENEIIRIYGKRWDIGVFFKICKSYLKLTKECRSLSYDACY